MLQIGQKNRVPRAALVAEAAQPFQGLTGAGTASVCPCLTCEQLQSLISDHSIPFCKRGTLEGEVRGGEGRHLCSCPTSLFRSGRSGLGRGDRIEAPAAADPHRGREARGRGRGGRIAQRQAQECYCKPCSSRIMCSDVEAAACWSTCL